MNNRPVFLVVGDFSDEHIDLPALCAQFGWRLKLVPSLDHASLADPSSIAAAGLIDASLDGADYFRLARRLLPQVLWVACTRFSSTVPWTELERLGAFHCLHRPLHSAEFLHALGFVDAFTQQQRRLDAALDAVHAA